MKLEAFHNDPAIKAKYLRRVERHIAADQLVRGIGWNGEKGCAVGCTLHMYNHARYPIDLGIPEWLGRLEDTLFEGMSIEKSRTWPRDFLAACPVGDDLDRVKAPFMIHVLQSTLGNFNHAKSPSVLRAVEGSIALWQRSDVGSEEWESAAWSARSAAESAAKSAAKSAARSAWSAAWSAAESAARNAARNAAESAAWSAGSAAWSATYDQFADALLALLAAKTTGEA